jgi:hypothetical protein
MLAGLICQHRGERRPAGVVHRLGQPGPAEPGHAQVLHLHRLGLADDRRGFLVQPVPPRISHPGVHPGDLRPGLVPVAAPFSLRDRAFWALRSLRSARRRKLGFATLLPSDRTAKWVSPKSMPTSRPASGSGSSAVCTTKLAKYRPAASMITVTLDGADGRGRDQRTGTSPIFGRRSLPFGRILNRALAVNRIACRRSLRDLNLGRPLPGAVVPSARRRSIPAAPCGSRRTAGRPRSGPRGPAAGSPRRPRRAMPARGWPWPRSAGPRAARR